MASKNATGKTNSSENSAVSGVEGHQPPQFIKYRLNDEEMAQAKNACEQFSDIGEIFTQMIYEGYKVSAGFDSYGGGIQVFMTPVGKNHTNKGWTLTARAPSLLLAIGVLAFKHYTLFSQVWPKEADVRQGSNWG